MFPPRLRKTVSSFGVRGNAYGNLQNKTPEFRILVCSLDLNNIWVMRCQEKQELIFRTQGKTQNSVA